MASKLDWVKGTFNFLNNHFFKVIFGITFILIVMKFSCSVDCTNGKCEIDKLEIKKGTGINDVLKKNKNDKEEPVEHKEKSKKKTDKTK